MRDDLREVRALLGAQARTLPPEPPDLGARIAAALAAEPPLRARRGPPSRRPCAPAGGTGPRAARCVALPTRRRRWPAYLAVAASVAVVGLGGTYLVGTLGGGGSDAGTAAEVSSADRDSADSGGGAAAPGVTVPPGSVPDPGVQARDGDVRVLRHRLHRRRPGRPGGARCSSAPTTVWAPSRPRRGAQEFADSGREDCLAALGRAGIEPAATDVATYEGQQAVVLVLPSGRGYDVLVVPVGCGSGDDRVLAETRLR